MKTTKDKVLSRLANRKTNLKKQSVKLSLINELDYEYDTLQDELDRLSYTTGEWFDEKYDVWFDIGRDIYDVYFNNSEGFLEPADLVDDLEKLNEIKEKAEELGLTTLDVYPEWPMHVSQIEYLTTLHEMFERQKQRFEDESRSI
tara:strand:- start:183 stop:617 length:435 start_codon:yes stop_codon:yes gene_type:complete